MDETRIVRPPVEVATYDEVSAQAHELDRFYRHLMREGTDYGTIPGTPKPTLYKAGAELLRAWAGLLPRFQVDSTGTDLADGVYNYQVVCRLYRRNQAGDEDYIGEGLGSCSSLESRYRWRWVYDSQLPPNLDKSILVKKKTRAKSGGEFTTYRIENENPHDLGNTILKMAKKRAFVDAILTVTGASRIFTQDLDEEDIASAVKAGRVPKGKPPVENPKAKSPAEPALVRQPVICQDCGKPTESLSEYKGLWICEACFTGKEGK